VIPKLTLGSAEIQNGGFRDFFKNVGPEDQMFTVDLQDSYYHINMYKTALSYMKFKWKGQYYIYCVISFRLAISPFIFSKMMKSVISHLKQLSQKSCKNSRIIHFSISSSGSNKTSDEEYVSRSEDENQLEQQDNTLSGSYSRFELVEESYDSLNSKIVVSAKKDLVIFMDVSNSEWRAALNQKLVRGF
jgi:hypothetical protein